jgi:hypothetical protein
MRFLKNAMPISNNAHRRQWDFLQAKKAKRKAAE